MDRKALGQEEKDALRKAVDDGREKLDRLRKIRAERDEVLRDLKEKVRQSLYMAIVATNNETDPDG